MENVKTCSTDNLSFVSDPSEQNIDLSHCSNIEEKKVSSCVVETGINIVPNLSNKENKPELKGSNLFSDGDDSFEVFIPLRKTSSQNSNEPSKKKTGKKKVIKKNSRTRACPYFSTKSIKNHFKSPTKSQEDKDLELALARSLLDVSGTSELPAQHSDNSDNTLFGAKKENPFKLKNWTGKKNAKKNLKSILSTRTSNDRERIITQKLAIVLLESKKTDNNITYNREIELSSSLLQELLDKNSTFWELSKIKCAEINQFYVESLSKFIEPIQCPINMFSDMVFQNEATEGSSKKTAGSSQIKPEVRDIDENSDPTIIPQAEKAVSSIEFGTKLESLKLLSDDWSAVFGDEELSDVDILLPSGIVPCHKMVFKARCPEILNEVICLYKPHAIDLSHYPPESTRTFLKYIYTGRTDDISNLSKDEKRDLTALARKFKLHYLHTLISSCTEIDLFYSQSTRSAPCDSPDRNQDSSNVKDRGISCDASISSKNKDVSEKENFILDGPPIILTSSSSSSCDVKYFESTKKTEIKSPKDSRPFKVFSRRSLSPDLFDNTALEVNESSFKVKRKSGFECDIRKKKRILSSSHNLENLSQNIEKSPFSSEVLTLDSSADDTRSPEKENNDIKLWREKVSSSTGNDISSNVDNIGDNSYNSSFHFNFDINESETPSENGYSNKINEDNKSVLLSNNSRESPPVTSDNDIRDIDSSPKTKKSSLDKFLHTSFPSFVEDIIDVESINKKVNTSTPRPSGSKELTATPDQEVIIKDATPLANYSTMASPDLQSELSKYGLKPTLGRKKAKALLRYIYDQTHRELPPNSEPLEEDSSTPSSEEKR